jgi:transcriptional regulator with XRE-family HTH domain
LADLATRLKAARRARRLTAAQLVDAMGAFGERRTPSYIYQLESGAQDNPTLAVLKALADSLQVTVGWLVEGEDLQQHMAELGSTAAELNASLAGMVRDVVAMAARAEQLAHDGSAIAQRAETLGSSGRAMARLTELLAPDLTSPLRPAPSAPVLTEAQRSVLASRLYGLRVAARLEIKKIESALGRRRLALAAIEQAEAPVHPRIVEELLTLYGIDDPRERVCVMSIASGQREPAWYDQPAVPLALTAGYHMESRATHIWNYQLQYVPTLLQTEEYSRAACQAAISPDTRKEIVAAGMSFAKARQEILERTSPPAVWTLLDEGVFLRPVGTPEVRLQQLDVLIKLAKLPNISIQVIPFTPLFPPPGDSSVYVARTGPFTLWRLPGDEPDAVALHCFATDHLLGTDEVDAYKTAFNWSAVTATQPGRDTLDLLQHHRARLQRELG